jgi:hypothetical protein
LRSASLIVRKNTHGIAELSGLTPATLPVLIVWMKILSV